MVGYATGPAPVVRAIFGCVCGHVKPLLYVYVLLLATQHGQFAPVSYLVIGDSLEDNRTRVEMVRRRLFSTIQQHLWEFGKWEPAINDSREDNET